MPGALGIGAPLEPPAGGGASNGVLSKLTHVPRKSGCPSAVLAGTNAFVGGGADCAHRIVVALATMTTAASAADAGRRTRLVMSTPRGYCASTPNGAR